MHEGYGPPAAREADVKHLGRRSFMALRTAQPADAAAVAAVHVRSWQVGYRGLLPDEYLDGLRPEDRARRYTFGERDPGDPETIVAVERGAICGFATIGSGGDDDPPGAGQLLALYVDPAQDEVWGVTVEEVRNHRSLP